MRSARRGGMIWDAVRLWLLLSLATLLAAYLVQPAPVRADEPHHAALIVRDGEGRTTYAWVPFVEDEIDGVTLLKRSGIPVVTVGFGALGEGVCSINGEGCGVSECRRNVCQASSADAPYWQYFKQDRHDPARWTWLALGPSASTVVDGDVFGWSWTAKEPQLPALPAREIAALAGADDPHGSTTPALRTLVPEGVSLLAATPPPDPRTTAAAAGILFVIAACGAVLVRRRRLLAVP